MLPAPFPLSQFLRGVAALGLTGARVLQCVLPTFTIIYSAELDTFQTSYYTTVCSNTNICSVVQQQFFCEYHTDCRNPTFPCPPHLPRTEQPHHDSGNYLENQPHKNPSGKPPHFQITCPAPQHTSSSQQFPLPWPHGRDGRAAGASIPTTQTLPVLQARHGEPQCLSLPDGMPRRKWKFFLFPPPHNKQNVTQIAVSLRGQMWILGVCFCKSCWSVGGSVTSPRLLARS